MYSCLLPAPNTPAHREETVTHKSVSVQGVLRGGWGCSENIEHIRWRGRAQVKDRYAIVINNYYSTLRNGSEGKKLMYMGTNKWVHYKQNEVVPIATNFEFTEAGFIAFSYEIII